MSSDQRHAQCLLNSGLIPMGSHGPTDHAPRKQIEDGRHVEPSLRCPPPVMPVTHFVLGVVAALIPIEQVLGNRISVLTVGRAGPMSSPSGASGAPPVCARRAVPARPVWPGYDGCRRSDGWPDGPSTSDRRGLHQLAAAGWAVAVSRRSTRSRSGFALDTSFSRVSPADAGR